jgi:hypothetical protein
MRGRRGSRSQLARHHQLGHRARPGRPQTFIASGTETGCFGGMTQTITFTNQDTRIPAAPGHYDTIQILGLSAPGIASHRQVASGPRSSHCSIRSPSLHSTAQSQISVISGRTVSGSPTRSVGWTCRHGDWPRADQFCRCWACAVRCSGPGRGRCPGSAGRAGRGSAPTPCGGVRVARHRAGRGGAARAGSRRFLGPR